MFLHKLMLERNNIETHNNVRFCGLTMLHVKFGSYSLTDVTKLPETENNFG